MEKKEKILILGAGAIGALYGGKLQQAGCDVSVIAHSDGDIILARGIEIQSVWGDFVFRPTAVYRSVSEVPEPPSYLIIALKALSDLSIPTMILPLVGSETVIVLLQNGIGIESAYRQHYPNNILISSLAFVCSNKIGPGNIHHLDYGKIVFGNYPKGENKHTHILKSAFDRVGVPCEIDADIQHARWVKLVWNAPFNPLSVLFGGLTTKEIMTDPYLKLLAETVMHEILCVAKADGYTLDKTIIRKNLEDTEKMRPYKTSMLLDYERSRPLEIDAILGNVSKIAHKYGVKVPLIDAFYVLLKALNR